MTYKLLSPKRQLIELINERKVVKTEAVTTSAGEQTTTYLDIPGVLGDASALKLGIAALAEHLSKHNLLMKPNMFVGPMTGSIPLAVGIVGSDWVFPDVKWSIIRDKVKDHGLGRAFVGAEPGPGDKVILVDDVASSGASLIEAWEEVAATGAEILAVVPLVDRGDRAAQLFTGDQCLVGLVSRDGRSSSSSGAGHWIHDNRRVTLIL
jgi:orotate phosphoribosyltransferase